MTHNEAKDSGSVWACMKLIIPEIESAVLEEKALGEDICF